MKIIFVNKKRSSTHSINVGAWSVAFMSVLFVCAIGVPSAVYLNYLSETSSEIEDPLLNSDVRKAWSDQLDQQEMQIEQSKEKAELKLAAITLRVAELQARLVRLDALGERLTTMAKLDNGEFDFSHPPALGGPESELGDEFTPPLFTDVIDELASQIENRQHQLETLEALMTNRKLESDVFIAGRPIKKGWMSSRFGRRNDPFTGKIAWHHGVDFAGKDGADIIAVAAGVVTWSGERYGYGEMVEISHGNGFKTRYAHCKENLVQLGDVVKKGQVVALMGSTGRSTGPHVHFEVYKHGRAVDPAAYIHRASR